MLEKFETPTEQLGKGCALVAAAWGAAILLTKNQALSRMGLSWQDVVRNGFSVEQARAEQIEIHQLLQLPPAGSPDRAA